MLPLSDAARAAIAAGTCEYRPRVDLYKAGVPTVIDAPLDEGNPGSVTVDETAAVSRTATINFAASDAGDVPLVPLLGGPLEPSSTEAWVHMDLRLPSGAVEPVILAKLQLQRPEASDAGVPVVSVTGRDYAQRIVDAALDGPYDIPAGTNGATAIRDLIDAGVPGLAYVGFDATTTPFTSTDWHLADGDDRWARAGEIALSLGKRVQISPSGSVVLAAVLDPSAQPVVWTYDESPDSVLTGVKHVLDRTGAKSHAIVVGQPSGSAPPVRSDAYDLDPGSPTYFPAFGDSQVRLTSGFVGDQAQADAASLALLRANRGLVEIVEMSALPVHALEEGDAVLARRAALGIDAVYVLSRFTLPLGPPQQTLTARSRRVG